ncbi:hypothetical protein FE391_03720 [Nonomuraea sp. KC401]|uniref:hypothetical protein n=1 Tax=unclassified Nonomuraea TaxID=2593643 RepID=UPI0010FCDDE3|nr:MULTISPECIES: hypothetical protein [unclassified Nonomuraea]NBE92658.1 hypothetical protein [Nonomuraea sp. K271]TLF84609.1 hypothetical protein FE391_03720 [Nonomuraea sp. KC401]
MHHFAKPAEPAEGGLRGELAELIASFRERLAVVEIDAAGIRVFEVRADEVGATRHTRRASAKWSTLTVSGEEVVDAVHRIARDLISADEADPVLIARIADGDEQQAALRALRRWRPSARLVEAPGAKVGELLGELAAEAPLRQTYDLIVARERAQDGRLELVGRRLFGAGAKPGDATTVAVTCTDAGGMLLAVSAWSGPLQPSELVSAHHAPLPPGRHVLRAVLERPGLVRFPEVPGLQPDTRTWEEVVTTLPARLQPAPGPGHLVCAIETAGTREEFEARCHWAGYVIDVLAERRPDPQQLQVSVVGYGTHVYGTRRADRSRPAFAAWSASTAQARAALESLRPTTPTYPHAAQLEDMLAEVSTRLLRQPANTRTALLTIGARPPHPPRSGLDRVPACPQRYDWLALLREMEQRHDLRSAVICDHPPAAPTSPWHRLGSTAVFRVDAVNAEELAFRLGLVSEPAKVLSLPFVSQSEDSGGRN